MNTFKSHIKIESELQLKKLDFKEISQQQYHFTNIFVKFPIIFINFLTFSTGIFDDLLGKIQIIEKQRRYNL
ncbi:unnamed protein product [Paramecium primaurelia]|uniref:Transmembrane protein n=1 Tax=Paramecium primaurelia TaxID=5886 RepID=A0A8S1NWR4_PARPR|nr:unnamed protein product [Paramecium primaurelia]